MSTIRNTMSATTLLGDDIVNYDNEKIGKLDEIMIDVTTGEIAYLVLAAGGIFQLHNKLFAIPFHKVKIDEANKKIVINAAPEAFENAPGFNHELWPDNQDIAEIDHNINPINH